MYNECQHVRPSGAKCKAVAIRGHRYCYFHFQSRRSPSGLTPAAELANGGPAPATVAATLTMPLLEDRSAVQVALTQILSALAANQIDNRRAGLLLYGLQIASANCVEHDKIVERSSVRELEITPEGEEIGPVVTQKDYWDDDDDDEGDDDSQEGDDE